MSADSTNLLMAMVERVCAPVLEQVLDKIELQALQEASARLRTENAELRKALKLPQQASMDAAASGDRRRRSAAQALTQPAMSDASATNTEPTSILPLQDATILLWPFAKAPVRVRQLVPDSEAPPAWVILYQSALAETPDTLAALTQLRSLLQTHGSSHKPVRRRAASRFLEFIW